MAETEIDGSYILPILERADETTQRQVDTQEELSQTLKSLVKVLQGFQGGGVSGQRRSQSPSPSANKNPIQPQNPSTLNNVFSFIGEKKDKAVEFIKKGFFKLFKTDYFTNLLKSVGALAKAIGNALFGWLKFFIMMAFIDPSGGFLRDIIKLFTEIGMILFKIIMPLIPVAIKMMFNTIVYVFKLILSLIPTIITVIMNTFTQLGNTFPILKPFIGFINQFLSAIRSLFIVFNDPRADKGNGIKKFLKKVFEILLDMVGKAVEFIAPYVPKVINAISDFIMQTLIPALIKYVPKLLDVFSEGLDMIITKYPNLKVWLQPLKDIFDMLSAYIGSFAKFDSGAYVRENAEYQKLEKATMQSKEYTRATEEKRLKMLSDLQYGFMVDNEKMVKDAEAQFIKQTDDKLNLAKQKWGEFLDHIMETLGKAYTELPTVLKWAIWIVVFIQVISFLASVIGWFAKLKIVFLLVGKVLAGFFSFIFSIPGLITLAIIAVIASIIAIWYYWDDIKKFFSDMSDYISKWFSDTLKSISDWYDKLDIMTPLKNIGLAILGFFGDLIDGLYDEFLAPWEGIIDEFVGLLSSIKLPSWLGGSSENDKPKESPQVNPTGNISQDKLNKMALEKELAKQKYLGLPKNQDKLIKEDLLAKQRNDYFGQTNKGLIEGINKSMTTDMPKLKLSAPNIESGGSGSTTKPKDVDESWFTNFKYVLQKMFSSLFEWINSVLPDWFPGKKQQSAYDKIFSISNTKTESDFKQSQETKKTIESLTQLQKDAIKNYLDNSEYYRNHVEKEFEKSEEKYLASYLGEKVFSRELLDTLMKLRNDAFQNKPTNPLVVQLGKYILKTNK